MWIHSTLLIFIIPKWVLKLASTDFNIGLGKLLGNHLTFPQVMCKLNNGIKIVLLKSNTKLLF